MGKRKVVSSPEAPIKRKKHASKPPANDVTGRACSSHPAGHALVPHSNALESAPDISNSEPDPNFLDVMIDLALEVLTCSGPSDPRHAMAMGRLNKYAKPAYGVPALMDRFRSKGASTKAVEDVTGMMHMFQTAHDTAQKAKGPKELEYLVKRIVKEVEESLGCMYNHDIHSAIHRAFHPRNNNRTHHPEEDDNTPDPELKLELQEPDLDSIPPFQECESQSTPSRNAIRPLQADNGKKGACEGVGVGSSSKGGKSNANSGVDRNQEHESSDDSVEDSGQESGESRRAGIDNSSSESDEDSDSESGEDGGETSYGDVNGADDSESDTDSGSGSSGDSGEENGKNSDGDTNGASSSDSDTDSDTESEEEPTQVPEPTISNSTAASASKIDTLLSPNHTVLASERQPQLFNHLEIHRFKTCILALDNVTTNEREVRAACERVGRVHRAFRYNDSCWLIQFGTIKSAEAYTGTVVTVRGVTSTLNPFRPQRQTHRIYFAAIPKQHARNLCPSIVWAVYSKFQVRRFSLQRQTHPQRHRQCVVVVLCFERPAEGMEHFTVNMRSKDEWVVVRFDAVDPRELCVVCSQPHPVTQCDKINSFDLLARTQIPSYLAHVPAAKEKERM